MFGCVFEKIFVLVNFRSVKKLVSARQNRNAIYVNVHHTDQTNAMIPVDLITIVRGWVNVVTIIATAFASCRRYCVRSFLNYNLLEIALPCAKILFYSISLHLILKLRWFVPSWRRVSNMWTTSSTNLHSTERNPLGMCIRLFLSYWLCSSWRWAMY